MKKLKKFTFNERLKRMLVTFDEKDVLDAREMLETMQTPGWGKIMEYYEFAREQIIESGKKLARDPEKKQSASDRLIMLDGFDQAVLIPINFVEKAQEFMEKSKDAAKEESFDETNSE